MRKSECPRCGTGVSSKHRESPRGDRSNTYLCATDKWAAYVLILLGMGIAALALRVDFLQAVAPIWLTEKLIYFWWQMASGRPLQNEGRFSNLVALFLRREKTKRKTTETGASDNST